MAAAPSGARVLTLAPRLADRCQAYSPSFEQRPYQDQFFSLDDQARGELEARGIPLSG